MVAGPSDISSSPNKENHMSICFTDLIGFTLFIFRMLI